MASLYVVATPIGNLKDFSPRAIETLQLVDKIAAEDTRHSSKLLSYFGIRTPLLCLHDHNETQQSELLLGYLKNNQSIALISDAGTPLISDPGYRLVRLARQHCIPVIPIPGPCALIAALSASGLPSQHFVFEGFLSQKRVARCKRLKDLIYETRTLIFYEAPHRIQRLIEDMLSIFGPKRYAVIARELTKTFETIHGDSLSQLRDWLNKANQKKGEFVVLVKGADSHSVISDAETQRILSILLNELPINQAARLASKITTQEKNKLYPLALALMGKQI